MKLGRGQARRRGGAPRGRRPRSDWAGRANGRKKSTSDVQFEDACLQIIGARVGVWWEDDEAYYKVCFRSTLSKAVFLVCLNCAFGIQGEIISHDWYHKRLKIRYDDGIVETFSPLRDRFVWLTPRGVTAGATPDIVDAMRALGAANAISNNTQLCGGLRAERCSPFPLAIKRESSPSTAVVTPTEAAVSEAGTPNLAGRVVDSIRSMFGRPTSAASPVSLMATFGVVAQALNSQAIDPASASVHQDEEPVEAQVADQGGQGSRGEATMGGSRFAMTPEPGEAPAPPQSAPQGHLATNWRISLVFPGLPVSQMFHVICLSLKSRCDKPEYRLQATARSSQAGSCASIRQRGNTWYCTRTARVSGWTSTRSASRGTQNASPPRAAALPAYLKVHFLFLGGNWSRLSELK